MVADWTRGWSADHMQVCLTQLQRISLGFGVSQPHSASSATLALPNIMIDWEQVCLGWIPTADIYSMSVVASLDEALLFRCTTQCLALGMHRQFTSKSAAHPGANHSNLQVWTDWNLPLGSRTPRPPCRPALNHLVYTVDGNKRAWQSILPIVQTTLWNTQHTYSQRSPREKSVGFTIRNQNNQWEPLDSGKFVCILVESIWKF